MTARIALRIVLSSATFLMAGAFSCLTTAGIGYLQHSSGPTIPTPYLVLFGALWVILGATSAGLVWALTKET